VEDVAAERRSLADLESGGRNWQATILGLVRFWTSAVFGVSDELPYLPHEVHHQIIKISIWASNFSQLHNTNPAANPGDLR
jgi:hypothetical protein